jgi:hypothetical protein
VRLVGQAYYLDEDWKGTREFEDELVINKIKRGETPTKISLQLLGSACVHLRDGECTARALKWLIRYYPTDVRESGLGQFWDTQAVALRDLRRQRSEQDAP